MDAEQLKQKNKSHRTLREELKKRWKNRKAKEKEKKRRHKEYSRDGQKDKFFQQREEKAAKGKKDALGVKTDKLYKKLQKFLIIYDDDIKDFYEIFQSLDNGDEVDISEIENKNIQKLLAKIFKLLGVKGKKSSYKKDSDECKIRSLATYAKNAVSCAIERLMNDKSDDEDEDDEKDRAGRGKGSAKYDSLDSEAWRPSTKSQGEASAGGEKRGTSAQGEGDDSNKPKRDEWMQGTFGDMFGAKGGQQQQSALRDFLDHRQKKRPDGTALAQQAAEGTQSRLAEGSAPLTDPDPAQEQERVRAYMQQYDAQFRPKSLLEEHQEMLAEKRRAAAEGRSRGVTDRRPFDREKDLMAVDSKKMFNAMRNSDVLGTMFGKGKIQSSFL